MLSQYLEHRSARKTGSHFSADALGRIHLLNHGAILSHGAIASHIPGVNVAAERVSASIAASLFREDIEAIRRDLEAFDEPELESTPFFVR